jgi:uncharacterized membrane protein
MIEQKRIKPRLLIWSKGVWKGLSQSSREEWLHRLFKLGVALKGLDGLLETVSGVLFLLTSRSALTQFVFTITRPELLEDPDDWIANTLRHTFAHLSASGKLFGGVYLLVHGVIKLFLARSLLGGKLWSFPAAVAVLIAFVGYQIYRVNVRFSWVLLSLTILDSVIVVLVWHEYLHLKHRRGRPK